MKITESDIRVDLLNEHMNPFIRDVLKSTNLQFLLSNGGFVAGGFPRIASRAGSFEGPRGWDYFGSGGDVDVFFRDDDSFRKCLTVTEANPDFLTENVSDCSVSFRHKRSYLKVQLVNCETGSPESVISSFDIVNSMVGFDNKYWYSIKDREDLENDNLLDLNNTWYFGGSLPKRLKKYLEVWKYKGLTPSAYKILQEFTLKIVELPDETKKIPYSYAKYRSSCLSSLGSKPARRSFPNSVDVVSVVKSLVRIVPEVDLILLLEKALEVKFNSTIFGQTYEIRKNVVLEEIKRRQQKL